MKQLYPLPTPTNWDLRHLSNLHSSVRVHRLMELGLVRKLLNDLLEAGLEVTVDDGNNDVAIHRSSDVNAIMEAIFLTETCNLYATIKSAGAGKPPFGYVHLELDNMDWDVIQGVSKSLEGVVAASKRYAAELAEWL